MGNMFKYNGYFGSVEYSIEDMTLHGKIECINDVVTYEADTLPALEAAFKEAVDDYIQTCNSMGRSPDKVMGGSFNIRIGEDLHKKAYLQAKLDKITLNEFVKKSIEEKLQNKKQINFYLSEKIEKDLIKENNETHFSLRSTRSIDFTREDLENIEWRKPIEKRIRH